LDIPTTQLFHSRVVANDPDAVAAMRVSQAAGVTIVRSQPANGYWKVGDTIAMGSIESLIRSRGEEKALKVLKTLVAAKRCPVVSHEIRAVEALLFDQAFGWTASAFDLVTLIRSKSIDAWRGQVIGQMKDAERIAIWKGVALAWVRAGRK
jgi:hypothetical protein